MEASPTLPVDLTILKTVLPQPTPHSRIQPDAFEEDLTEDLTIVDSNNKPKKEGGHSRFYLFLVSPDYPTPLLTRLRLYLHEVRRRMIESRDSDRIQYYHTVYQKLSRLGRRMLLRMKANMRT